MTPEADAADRSSRRLQIPWVPLALVALLAAAAVLIAELAVDPTRVLANLLLHTVYFLSLGLGALFFLAVLYLAQAGWFVAIRRVAEAMAAFVPVGGGLMLLVFLGREHLYPWARAAAAHDPLLAEKAAYLNPTGFAVRLLLAWALWSLFAVYLRRVSRTQDGSADGLRERRRLKRASAVFVPVFAITFSLASFDWLMSLEPHWFSTMFAVYTFAGLFVGAIAAIAAAVVLLRQQGPLAGVVRGDHLHDLGKMLFAFSTFWAYIWVSQYLLIWYGNLPEEVSHFALRTSDPWRGLFALNVALNWGVPFVVLLGRTAKRNPWVLLGAAGVVLAGRWLDLYLLVHPPLATAGPGPGWIELVSFAGFAALFLLVMRRSLDPAPWVPTRDPLIHESLTYRS